MVSDNLKAAVIRFNPDDASWLNESCKDVLNQTRVSALPARPYKPKDMAAVERAVQLAQRRVMAALRNIQFERLQRKEANEAPFRKLEGSRRSWFETMDKPLLRPLPAHP